MNRMVDNEKNKKFVVAFWFTFAVAVIIFIGIFISINNRFKQASDLGLITINTTESIVPNEQNLVSASFSQDKTVNETIIQNSTLNEISQSGITANLGAGTDGNVVPKQQDTTLKPEVEEKKSLTFMAPVVRRNNYRLRR